MARSIETILNQMIETSELYPSLQGFNNSTASIYRLIMRVVSTGIHVFETLLDTFQAEILEQAKDLSPGTERYFVNRAYLFQYSEVTPQVLQINDRTVEYETINPALNIITQASCNTVNDAATNKSIVSIKLAKGVAGALEELNADELAAATSYFNQIRMAGQTLNVISNPSDLLAINADIYFDGQFIQTSIESDISDAIDTFLNTQEFDGLIYLQKVVDAIQAVPGVQDIVLKELSGRDVNTDFNNRTRIIKDYLPESGYMTQDTTNNNFTYYVV